MTYHVYVKSFGVINSYFFCMEIVYKVRSILGTINTYYKWKNIDLKT